MSFKHALGAPLITMDRSQMCNKVGLQKWVLLEEISWRQKSRQIQLKLGDRNTFFFHWMTNSNRRKNHLSKIKINGSWALEEAKIKQGVSRAFQQLL